MNALKTIFKFTFAFALIYWLVSSGKLDFNIFKEVLQHPFKLAFAGVGLFLTLFVVNFRYSIILASRAQVKIPLLKLFRYNWIGVFFNSVLPGSVSGDLVKIFYIKNEDKTLTTKFMLASIFIDRIFGLSALIVLLGTFSIFNYTELTSYSPDIKKLLDLNLLLFASVIFAFCGVYFFQSLPHRILQPLMKFSFLKKVLPKLLKLWDELCSFKDKIFILMSLSFFLQALSVITFWFLTESFAVGEFPITYALSIIPIGFVALAIPIAPSGLGVGHAVFHTLLGFIGISNGADLFNIYFFVMISFNLLGAIPYLLTKSKKQISFQNLDVHNEEI